MYNYKYVNIYIYTYLSSLWTHVVTRVHWTCYDMLWCPVVSSKQMVGPTSPRFSMLKTDMANLRCALMCKRRSECQWVSPNMALEKTKMSGSAEIGPSMGTCPLPIKLGEYPLVKWISMLIILCWLVKTNRETRRGRLDLMSPQWRAEPWQSLKVNEVVINAVRHKLGTFKGWTTDCNPYAPCMGHSWKIWVRLAVLSVAILTAERPQCFQHI